MALHPDHGGASAGNALVEELLRKGQGARWGVGVEPFRSALERSVARAFTDAEPGAGEVERYLRGLHLEDLALACACALGSDDAWEHFVREYRPALYRAADALDTAGGGREIADSLYAELYGLRERDGARQSLFAHYHGRSSLATWLRAVLAQRYVDRIRAERRLDPLPGEDMAGALAAPRNADPDPDVGRLRPLLFLALRLVIEALPPRDRLRFACYYADGRTLAETGRMLGEHEATVSRQLAKTRRHIRADVERRLARDHRLSEAEIFRAFEAVADDAGAFDLGRWGRKETADDRST